MQKIKVKNPQNYLWDHRPITGIHAELTDKCNSGCPMCPRYINNGSGSNPHLPNTEVTFGQFQEWFQPKFVRGLRKFLSCGNYGDPASAKDMLEIYRYLRKTNPHIGLAVNTNGSVRTKDWWKELGSLMKNPFMDYCTFSIDGLEDTNHLYRRNTNFKKIMENARAFIQAGGVAHWDYIVFDYNEHQVEKARELAVQMGFQNFNIKKTTRWHLYKNNRGEFDVRDKNNQYLYTLRQPLNEKYKDETFEILKDNLKSPNYITEQEFDHLYSEDIYQMVSDRNGGYIKIKHSEFEIQCRATQSRHNPFDEIFLSATGHVFPCCYLGGEPWRYDGQTVRSKDSIMEMIELNGGMDSISLHQSSLEKVLNTPIYSEMLRRSFKIDHPMRSRQCSTCCGKSWNKLDHGETGSKKDSFL